jgi:hypothetical protein
MNLLTRLRFAFGAVLVLTPRLLTRALPQQQIDARVIALARVLGLRWTLVGAAVDATHAPTMAGFAVARPSCRPLALASAFTASVIAAVEISEARRRHRLDASGRR